jgi:hypothetical protein
MDLSIIISISGKPGLYKVVGRSKNGLIAESLVDEKRIPVRSTDKVSALSDISIFTYEDDLPLQDVLVRMFSHFGGKAAPAEVENNLAETLREVLPEYDEQRVYASDLKKLFKWYSLLADKGLIDEEKNEEAAEAEEVVVEKEQAEEKKDKPKKPKKKAKPTEKS